MQLINKLSTPLGEQIHIILVTGMYVLLPFTWGVLTSFCQNLSHVTIILGMRINLSAFCVRQLENKELNFILKFLGQLAGFCM